jgi:ketosteroid isomerase-like protein
VWVKLQEGGYLGEQNNLQIIHKVYDAFGRGDVEGVISMLTDDVTWTIPGPPDVIVADGRVRETE